MLKRKRVMSWEARGASCVKFASLRFRNPQSAIRNRNGVLLLVVLSLLVLFMMLGTAFVITAKQSSEAAKALKEAMANAASPTKQGDLLDDVVNQLVRDTNNPNSALRYHSLLRDMYGSDGLTGKVDGVQWAGGNKAITGGQIVAFDLGNPRDLAGNLITLSPTDNTYNGLLLTFTSEGASASAQGQSVRIVGFRPPNTFRVMAFELADGSSLSSLTGLGELDVSKVLINGRPFNGTGVGYNPTAAAGSAQLSTIEPLSVGGVPLNPQVALTPNAVFFDIDPDPTMFKVDPAYYGLPGATSIALSRRIYTGIGGSDESYDAVDFQNMALALMPADPGETVFPDVTVGPGPLSLGNTIIPSFQRPALLNYWEQQLINAGGTLLADEPNLLRKILLRPNWLDHPNFTGSNPEYRLALSAFKANSTLSEDLLDRMIYGPWDVDNDNDGIRDSVWVDFGAPVVQRPDGTMVKPLAAILVLDMDGRLNLNAHGTLEHVKQPIDLPLGRQLAGTTSDMLPRGQGYGPAEISLASVVGNQFGSLLVGRINYLGRYGSGTNERPGMAGNYDLRAQMKMQGVPKDATTLSAYATPPDMLGRYALGINDFGQPMYEAIDNTGVPDAVDLDMDSPYELNLSLDAARGESPNGDDAPFSLAEMERLLRAFDVDAGSLPSRLWELADQFKSGTPPSINLPELNQWRNLLTTDSYDLPVPNVQVPSWINPADFRTRMGKPATNLTFADLLQYRLRVELGILDPTTITPAQRTNLRRSMAKLMPFDLADGLRMDINRPLGNGRDDDGNLVVDEPGENEGAYWAWKDAAGNFLPQDLSTPKGIFAGADGNIRDAIDRDGDGNIDPMTNLVERHNFRRQLLARHLYVMALTLADPFDLTTLEGKAKTRRLAQWAINVVDFRDPDNSMSPFEYDENPFDGWEVDGDLSQASGDNNHPERGVVWGSERPELVMTETLAWHDRRTEDHTDEDPFAGDTDGPGDVDSGKDPTYDQLMRPRGAFFLELYNPWPANPAANADVHAVDRTTDPTKPEDLGVNLGAFNIDPNDNTFKSPVWRLSIYKDGGMERDPDDPVLANRPDTIDRRVYFAGFDPGYNEEAVPVTAFYNDVVKNPIRPVRPGRYMVVGSGDETTTTSGVYESPVGDLDPSKSGTIVRRMVLEPGNLSQPLRFIEPVGTPTIPQPDPDPDYSDRAICDVAVINTVSVAGADTPRRLTLSEPADGYTSRKRNVLWDPTSGKDGQYVLGDGSGTPKAIDIPLDDDPDENGDPLLAEPGSVPGYRWIYLQRLANPLLPWNPEQGRPGHDTAKAVNPYRTVDHISANLTVFNGRNLRELGNRNSAARPGFMSVERGWQNDFANGRKDTFAEVNLWNTENRMDVDAADIPARPRPQPGDLTHFFTAVPKCTLGFLNECFEDTAAGGVQKQLKPKQPFPWLNWNNRPYVSQMELMQVPTVRSSQLLRAFSMSLGEKYDQSLNPTNPATPELETDGAFGHLQNFFRHKEAAGSKGIAGLYRILEYLHVPSRFVGTETWLNPAKFGGGTQVTNTSDPRMHRQPPFNRISTYRDPGKVNLNTIVDDSVYFGLMHGNPAGGANNVHPGPSWINLRSSRRGYTPSSGGIGMLAFNDDMPTFFANPFRSPDAGNLVPLAGTMVKDGVHCTLLREGSTAGTPLFDANTTEAYRNSDRNAYFRYQPMTRLANLVTTRSNVYAVWVTIGFFEVEEVPDWNKNDPFPTPTSTTKVKDIFLTKDLYNKVYPDGVMFGKEAGSQTGDIQRLREFAIIDRTIPVAFEPGKDHNVERAIRLRRRIE